MRTIATFLCLFMAAPQASAAHGRETRQAQWAAALQAAAVGSAEDDTDDLPDALQEALRRWSTDEEADAAEVA